MKIWIEQNLLMPLFLIVGLLIMIGVCLTGGFAASVGGWQSGAQLLAGLWIFLGLLVLIAGVGYVSASHCPRCGKRFGLYVERWKDRTAHNSRIHWHRLIHCRKCGYLQSEGKE